ncbi:MAG: glycosyltransferase family 39 protein [Acidobacteria bacterium]|nr:glycosyltransferase family 39 protein [Acidobacteriota bacterium]
MLNAECYISPVLRLLLRHRRFFLGTALAGLALRLCFLVYFPSITDDSRIYADFATNWLQHGIYGTTQAGNIVPTDERLPGYPAFLAAIFAIFGPANFRAVMLIQILLDLGTCLLIADLARRAISDRSARIAFALAALCPFLANYAAAVLTETLEVFFTVLALDCGVAAFEALRNDRYNWKMWVASGLAIGACILLRPDGGLLLAAIGLYFAIVICRRWRSQASPVPAINAAVIVVLCALVPLVPWTLRNLTTLHRFQPLAPRYATASDELAARGFNRWVRTWIVDYASVEEIYWSVPGDKIDPDKLPSRAFDSPQQRDATLALIDDYNESGAMTAALDVRFGLLASERIREHRTRYYVLLPSLRIVDMWLRPRTELLPPDVRWWEFNDDIKGSIMAVTFGLLNLAYVAMALMAVVQRSSQIRMLAMLGGFVLLRSAFLGSLENPETRYTLECYPVVIVLAAAFLTRTREANLEGS